MSGGGKSVKEIPSGSRKTVQSVKEIVNFASEIEIYAMLKECNMDPNEAVHRLLSQDTFHEVKSKREKKRETKDTPESRSRSMNDNPSRAARGGTERGVRTSSSQTGSYDYGVTHGKPVPKEENGTNIVSYSVIAGSATAGSNLSRKSTKLCEAASAQNTSHAMSLSNGPSLPSQAHSGFQHNWSRMPGQMSMADIVRMGRPQVKASSTHTVANDTFHASHDPIMSNMLHQSAKQSPTTIVPSDLDHEFNTSQDPISHGEESSRELGTGAGHYNFYDDWSLTGRTSAGTGSAHPETSGPSIYDDPSASSSLLADEYHIERHPGLDENQIREEDVNGECPSESIRETSISDREDSGESAHPDDDPLDDMSPYHTRSYAFEQHGVEDVDEEISSTTANLQQLNLEKGEPGASSTDDNPAVIIPSHLQVTNADCLHLSFGSFGSGGSATIPGSFSSKPLRSNNLEMAPLPEDTTLEQLNSRNQEYYDGDRLKSTLDESVTSRTSTSTISYDVPSASQPEIVKDETLAAAHGLQENFPSGSDYAFSATTQSFATYTYPDHASQMQNLSHFSSLMQPYTNSLPSSLSASTAPPLREYDLPFSALLTTQSIPTKYNTATPSVSGPISMPEVKLEVFSSPQPTPQAMPSSNITQHLQMHPYSQPTLPLGHFANMIGYPFLPQSYAYLPSAAFQQAYGSNSPFHQSQAAAAAAAAAMKYTQLPQYKTSISGSNLPQSPAFPPGYGGFTSSINNIPGSFSLNPTTTSANTTMGFEEALNSQYKEGSHYLPLQHNDNSAMWVHGAGSRTVSAHPGNTFYGFQGQQQQQNQPNAGFRQTQQLSSSHYGQVGYLNLYQSQQGGPTQEPHQQQNPSDGNLSGSPGQMWQHGY